MKRIAFIVFILFTQLARAQKVLPDFSANTNGKGRTIISWTNAYPKVTQISIQRSFDSLRNYKTILTVPDPNVLENGFVDTKAPTDFQFYRLFIVLDSGKYLFTKPKRPFWDTARKAIVPPVNSIKDENSRIIQQPATPTEGISPEKKLPERILQVKKRDTLVMQIFERELKGFRDSILQKTKDTLIIKSTDTLIIKPFIPKVVYKPSIYVYTAKDGNIMINVPNPKDRKYNVKFYQDNNDPLFEIKEVRESPLILDKSNFLHSGWFRFELFENGQLKEKHRFFIPKDF